MGDSEIESSSTPPLDEEKVKHVDWESFPVGKVPQDRNVSMGSVIDLVSENGRDDSIQGFGSPRFTPKEGCAPTPRMASSAEKENDGDLDNLDPRELSFTLPPQPVRVYNPKEWELVDWEKISQEELKNWMQFFGMKTTGGKAFMIRTLRDVLKYITEGELVPRSGSKEDLFNEFSDVIKEETTLYEKILLFEPVEVNEVHALLKSRKKTHWTQLSLACVREYLELVGAQVCHTSANSAGNNFGKFLKHTTNKRKLRVSLSAP